MAHSRLKSPRLYAWALGITLAISGVALVPWLAIPARSSSRSHDSYARVGGRVARDHSNPPPPTAPSPFHFRDLTRESGIDFSYLNGEEAGLRTILESLGGGVAIFDYDSDGRADLFFTGGGGFLKSSGGFTVQGLPNRLYRNLGHWRFQDVTEAVGLSGTTFYGHGGRRVIMITTAIPTSWSPRIWERLYIATRRAAYSST